MGVLKKVKEHLKKGDFTYQIRKKVYLKYLKLFYYKNDRKYLEKIYKFYFHKKPNIDNPVTMNEKILWLKLYWRDERCYLMADKYRVREYLKTLNMEHLCPKLYGVYKDVSEINLDKLPEKFVLKTTHDSGGVFICTDKKDTKKVQDGLKKMQQSLNKGSYNTFKEWCYERIEPRIIAEEYIESEDGVCAKDYKIFCSNGKAKYIFICSERSVGVKFDFFDTDWNWIDVRRKGVPNMKHHPQKPENLKELIEVAEKLSVGMPLVRIDLYNEKGKIVFGEFTFFTHAGNGIYDPKEMDEYFGNMIDISTVSRKE